jgi:hypothetical protein
LKLYKFTDKEVVNSHGDIFVVVRPGYQRPEKDKKITVSDLNNYYIMKKPKDFVDMDQLYIEY